MQEIGNRFAHRRFVGFQQVAVIIVVITRLTEGIYGDVNIEKASNNGIRSAEPAQPALILSEDYRYQDVDLFLDSRVCVLYHQYSQP